MSASCLVIDVGRTGVVLGVVALAAGALTGCVAQGCPAWAGYDTPTEAAEAAYAVVFGHVRKLASTGSLFGAAANIWSVEVTEWVKGDGPDTIEVLSPPSQCGPSDDPYFGADPFEEAMSHETSAIFLSGDDGDWMGLNPSHGIVELTAAGEVPPEW